MNQKVKSIIIVLLFLIAVAGLMVYAFLTSDFSNLKKASIGSDFKETIARQRYYSTDVNIKDDGVVDLGDFEINIGNGQKLITNISAKYNRPDSWSGGSGVDNEIKAKGSVIRHSLINAIMNQKEKDVRSYKVKASIINSINSNLSTTAVEEIYFNKLIISE